MRKNFTRYSLLGIVLASACADESAPAPAPAETLTSAGARIVRSDQPLTLPSRASAQAVAQAFVRTQKAGAELAATSQAPGRGGVTHVRMEQVAGGLRVHGAYAKVAVSARGEVLQLIDNLAPAGAVASAKIDERQALAAVMTKLGLAGEIGPHATRTGNRTELAVVGDLYRAPTVERVAYAAAAGLAEGFLVETWTAKDNLLDHTLVGGDGAILSIERRTASDSYNVYAEDPGKGPQTVTAGPGAGNAQSPAGWLAGAQTTINLTGNNAHAYLDADANNAPDAGGAAVTSGNFLTAANLTAAPSTTSNREVAVQNLFYLNNVAHDVLHRHGFNEANANFQTNNFGLGGAGGDPVQAEAQDGSGTDNANFSTPADGSAPRMQMYLWSGAAPDALVTVAGTDHGAYGAAFGPALTATGVSGALALYNDGTGTTSDGCEASSASLTGKVAIVDRGTCDFTIKVANAQAAGAVAVLIANNAPGDAFGPGGTNRKIKIPSAMVTQADGATLRAQGGTSATLRKNPVPALQIDGDLDADVVFHEYGHGLTWRMIGSMSGALSGAIGEGASDTLAFLLNGDDRIGEYSASSATGIRRYVYAGYPLSYNDVVGTSVHNDGEIYAGAMWRVLENYLAAGLTADDLLGDWVDGMNFTPAAPAYEDMRDGMLQAVAGTGRECLIWRGFATGGIGVGADGTISRRGVLTITESFTLPASCQ